MNSYPKLFYILKEINLFDKTNLVDELNSILKQKNVTKPEIIDYFKKPYLKWFVSPTDDQEKEHYVKKHHGSSNEPEWAKSTFDFNTFSNEHKEELAHTIDFFNQLSERDLKKIHKIPFPTVRELVKKWDQDLAKRMNSSIHHFKIGKDVEILKQWPNGYKIVKILSDAARKEEGDIMGHCVGGDYYADETILSLRDEHAMPHVTMEVDRDNNIQQIKGKQNREPLPKYSKYIREFIRESDLEIGKDGENIGYISWNGKYYDPDSPEWKTVYNDEIIPMQKDALLHAKKDADSLYTHVISLQGLYLKELPAWLKEVDFSHRGLYIANNLLTSLENCPEYIGGIFFAEGNKLKNLVGGPKKVNYKCYLSNNELISLEGFPECPDINVSDNKITSVKLFRNFPYLSKMNKFNIAGNELTSLDGLQNFSGYLDFDDNNVTTLIGGPTKATRSHYRASNNLLTNLEGAPETIGGTFSVTSNRLTSLDGCPKSVGGNFYCRYQKSKVKFSAEDVHSRCNVYGVVGT